MINVKIVFLYLFVVVLSGCSYGEFFEEGHQEGTKRLSYLNSTERMYYDYLHNIVDEDDDSVFTHKSLEPIRVAASKRKGPFRDSQVPFCDITETIVAFEKTILNVVVLENNLKLSKSLKYSELFSDEFNKALSLGCDESIDYAVDKSKYENIAPEGKISYLETFSKMNSSEKIIYDQVNKNHKSEDGLYVIRDSIRKRTDIPHEKQRPYCDIYEVIKIFDETFTSSYKNHRFSHVANWSVDVEENGCNEYVGKSVNNMEVSEKVMIDNRTTDDKYNVSLVEKSDLLNYEDVVYVQEASRKCVLAKMILSEIYERQNYLLTGDKKKIMDAAIKCKNVEFNNEINID